eukprot:10690808-Lingulodinium_polyedra.AAC.1
MERACVWFANRCSNGRSIRPHHYAASMRSNQPSAATAARKLHDRAFHEHANCSRAYGTRARARAY